MNSGVHTLPRTATARLSNGAPPGAQSPYDIASGIDQKILGKHQQGGEALNTYDPLAGEKGGWSASYWNGGIRDLP